MNPTRYDALIPQSTRESFLVRLAFGTARTNQHAYDSTPHGMHAEDFRVVTVGNIGSRVWSWTHRWNLSYIDMFPSSFDEAQHDSHFLECYYTCYCVYVLHLVFC